MQVFLLRNGAQTGPFPIDDVRTMIEAKGASLSDFAWHPGLDRWVPLSRIFAGNISSTPPPFPPAHPVARKSWVQKAEGIFEGIVGGVSGGIDTVAGVGKVEGLSGKQFLSEVWKRRKDDEMEDLFITGTRSATPALNDINTEWPKPWVFAKAMGICLLLYAGFYIGAVPLQNQNMIPGTILIGSFAIPLCLLIFFIEMNVARNFSVYQTLKLVFLGALFALLLVLILDDIFPAQNDANGDLTWLGAAATGLVEETAKVLAAIIFMGKRRFNWSLNGLLIGAAIGTGFAAFESAGYALNSLLLDFKESVSNPGSLDYSGMLQDMVRSIQYRAWLAPGGHIVWAALSVAALWRVKGDNPFRWRMLTDPRFLRVFAIVVVLHTLWDCPLLIPFVGDEWGFSLKAVLLILVAWVWVFGFIQDGLKQIRQSQLAHLPPPVPPTAAAVA